MAKHPITTTIDPILRAQLEKSNPGQSLSSLIDTALREHIYTSTNTPAEDKVTCRVHGRERLRAEMISIAAVDDDNQKRGLKPLPPEQRNEWVCYGWSPCR